MNFIELDEFIQELKGNFIDKQYNRTTVLWYGTEEDGRIWS